MTTDNNNQPPISLMRPPGHSPPAGGGKPGLDLADLGLASVIAALDFDGRHSRFITSTLSELACDPAVITYRQAAVDDLLSLPALYEHLAGVLPQLAELGSLGRGRTWKDVETGPLHQVANRLAELQLFVSVVEELWSAFEAAGPAVRAEGWLALRQLLDNIRQDRDYQRLTEELPILRERFARASSITLGLNLDEQLRPESVTIVSINEKRFSARGSLLGRLLGERTAEEAWRGLGPLYRTEDGRVHTPEHELFREMNRLLEKVAGPVAQALARFTRVSSAGLAGLEPEIAFYLGAVRLVKRLQAEGLAFCRPEIAPVEERAGQIHGIYSLDLALRLRSGASHHRPVPNDVNFGPQATIFILTGPNSGGKTTYTRAIGQAQALFQAGLPVPGRSARLSPVDRIFTHFATAERVEVTGGRLEEELERLAHLFQTSTRFSLILLNEPLASTDHASARALSRDLLSGLRLLGARAVYVTHIYELVEDAYRLEDGGASVVNLVAGIREAGHGEEQATHASAPTYTITPGQPHPLGYASELARRHGLNLAQITRLLQDRGYLQ